MAKVDWDQTEYEEGRSGFETLPKGRYPARCEDIEKKPTRKNDGYFYEVEFSLIGENFKNRKVWANLNVSNPSTTAQRIGREQWNSLCVAAGFSIGQVKDTKEVVGKRMVILVDIERGDDGSERNRVTGFFPFDATVKSPSASTAKPAAAKPAAKSAPAGAGDPDDDEIPF